MDQFNVPSALCGFKLISAIGPEKVRADVVWIYKYKKVLECVPVYVGTEFEIKK